MHEAKEYVEDKAHDAKEAAAEKATAAKEAVAEKLSDTKEYIAEKATHAKEAIASALGMSFLFRRLLWRRTPTEPFMLELPDYKLPQAKSIAIGLWTRAAIFLKRLSL